MRNVVILQERCPSGDTRRSLRGENLADDLFRRSVVGMGFASEYELDRVLATDEGQRPLRQECDEVEPLVGGESSGETDREAVGIESAPRGLGVVKRLTAPQPVADGATR